MEVSFRHDSGRRTSGATPLGGPGEAHWRELVAQLGVEVATPLTSALERVLALSRTGQIDRAGLRALRDEVERARASGMIGQQLARYASGRLRQSHERVQLARALQAALAQRVDEARTRSLELRPLLKAVEVIVDPALLASMLNTLLDWTLCHAQAGVELRIDIERGPGSAQLGVRFARRPGEAGDGHDGSLDSLAWHLLQQTAWTMGLQLARRDEAATTWVSIAFPRAINEMLDGVSAIELDHRPSAHAKPLAGNHVLVVASRRELSAQICDAVRHMGLIIDVVSTVEDAAAFCRDGLPHAIVFESSQRGDTFDALRAEIDAEAPEFVFVEIADEGTTFEISGFTSSGMARVGRDAIDNGLPSALMIELTKGL